MPNLRSTLIAAIGVQTLVIRRECIDMECPYCKKDIYGMTGLQELQKFQKHLKKCKKSPHPNIVVDDEGNLLQNEVSLAEALEIRAESGQ